MADCLPTLRSNEPSSNPHFVGNWHRFTGRQMHSRAGSAPGRRSVFALRTHRFRKQLGKEEWGAVTWKHGVCGRDGTKHKAKPTTMGLGLGMGWVSGYVLLNVFVLLCWCQSRKHTSASRRTCFLFVFSGTSDKTITKPGQLVDRSLSLHLIQLDRLVRVLFCRCDWTSIFCFSDWIVFRIRMGLWSKRSIWVWLKWLAWHRTRRHERERERERKSKRLYLTTTVVKSWI